jgi:hypothetical protein
VAANMAAAAKRKIVMFGTMHGQHRSMDFTVVIEEFGAAIFQNKPNNVTICCSALVVCEGESWHFTSKIEPL